jgi:hypothetical protein
MREPLEQHRLEPTEAFIAALEQALAARTFVRLAFGKPRKPQLGQDLPPEQASARLVDIKGEAQLSILLRHKTKDITRNARLPHAGAAVSELLHTAFHNAHLFTTEADLDLRSNNKGEPRLYRNKPSLREAKVESIALKLNLLQPRQQFLHLIRRRDMQVKICCISCVFLLRLNM